MHPVFHVSQLCQCLRVPEETVPTEAVDLQETLEYVEYPMKILDRAVKETRGPPFHTARYYGAITQKENRPGRRRPS